MSSTENSHRNGRQEQQPDEALEEQARLRNLNKNQTLREEGERMKGKIHVILDRHEMKIEETILNQEEMGHHKTLVFDQVESFFELIKKKVEKRCEDLKQQYLQIEAREKRRLKYRQMKLERETKDLRDFSKEFDDFFADFDTEMDFLANRCQFDYFWTEFKQLEQTMKKATNFFAVSEFKFPDFNCLPSEVELLDQIGKVTDNSDFSMPLVAFNTHQLSAFHYIERAREFEKLQLKDDENYAVNDIPHYFKSVYIPDDKFLLVGGLERETALTSNRCFLIDDKGKVMYTNDMFVPRQYFTVATDYANELIYVIGGYNHVSGVLGTFETFHIKKRKWSLADESQVMAVPRINASACKCGPKHLYLFGGLSAEDEFLDSIERYNTQLGIWTILDVKMPMRITNNFAFSFNPDYIVILGGMMKKDEKFVPKESQKIYELQDRVFVLKTKNFTWKDLKPFPFKKKLGNVVYNNHGKFFCFVIESNKELPQLFVYDVRASFPQFNKYWEHHIDQKSQMQKIKGKHIQVQAAEFNDTPKQNQQKLNQTSQTISLLQRASNSLQLGTEFLGLTQPDPPEVEPEPVDPYHRIEIVDDELLRPQREIVIPRNTSNPDAIELDPIGSESQSSIQREMQ